MSSKISLKTKIKFPNVVILFIKTRRWKDFFSSINNIYIFLTKIHLNHKL